MDFIKLFENRKITFPENVSHRKNHLSRDLEDVASNKRFFDLYKKF
jgi:hypothetical protein